MSKVNFTTEAAVVVKFINEIKASAGAYRHNVNQALIGALYQAATYNNADALKQLQQVMIESAPRDLSVFNKLVSKFGVVVLDENETKCGKYSTKLVKGMMGDAKSIASRKESLNNWLETGIITVKNPAYVDEETTKGVAKRIEVVFEDVYAYADYAKEKAEPVKKTMADYQKGIIAKMRKDINLRAADFIDGFLRNVGIDKELNDSQRITKAEAAQLIELINKFAK